MAYIIIGKKGRTHTARMGKGKTGYALYKSKASAVRAITISKGKAKKKGVTYLRPVKVTKKGKSLYY